MARPTAGPASGPAVLRVAGPAVTVVAVLAAVASGVQVVRIGHSGAQAAWHGVASSGPSAGGR